MYMQFIGLGVKCRDNVFKSLSIHTNMTQKSSKTTKPFLDIINRTKSLSALMLNIVRGQSTT